MPEPTMAICLQTSKGRNIPNRQGSQLDHIQQDLIGWIENDYARAEIRTGVSTLFNCHGLTFGSRRVKIEPNAIQMILDDDLYESVEQNDVKRGDIIVYRTDDGELAHSGIVVELSPLMFSPWICSKWGDGPEVVHRYLDVPIEIYGSDCTFYRCRL